LVVWKVKRESVGGWALGVAVGVVAGATVGASVDVFSKVVLLVVLGLRIAFSRRVAVLVCCVGKHLRGVLGVYPETIWTLWKVVMAALVLWDELWLVHGGVFNSVVWNCAGRLSSLTGTELGAVESVGNRKPRGRRTLAGFPIGEDGGPRTPKSRRRFGKFLRVPTREDGRPRACWWRRFRKFLDP
jgi:hypothetical protein